MYSGTVIREARAFFSPFFLVRRSEYLLFPLDEFNDVETSPNWCWMVLGLSGTSED